MGNPKQTAVDEQHSAVRRALQSRWLMFAAGVGFAAVLYPGLVAAGHRHLNLAALGLFATLAGMLTSISWLRTLPVRAPIVAYAPAVFTVLVAAAAGMAVFLPDDPATLVWGVVAGLLVGVAGHLPLLVKHLRANQADRYSGR